jgi:hypothetical protein
VPARQAPRGSRNLFSQCPDVRISEGKINMKVRLASTAAVIFCTSLLLLAGIRCAQAGEIKIVSPSAYKDREGEEGGGGTSFPPFRVQQVFPAADFAALGNQPHWLVRTTFRPDKSLTSPLTALYPDLQFRFATMPVGPPNLSLRFADNLGSDFKHFYRGPWTLVADVAASGPGPREFYNSNYASGVTPYLYDPSQGNLLLDAIGWLGGSPDPPGDFVPGMQTALYGSSPFATQGVRIAAFIHQFTFIPVPEPSTALIVFVGSLALAARCRPTYVNLRR